MVLVVLKAPRRNCLAARLSMSRVGDYSKPSGEVLLCCAMSLLELGDEDLNPIIEQLILLIEDIFHLLELLLLLAHLDAPLSVVTDHFGLFLFELLVLFDLLLLLLQ